MPLDTAPGPDQLTEPPGGGGYVPLVQGPLPGWGTVPILTWTRPASRYRSTKVLSLGTDWLSSRETMEKKARWPGTTSTSRTRADVALISAGGRAVAEGWLQRPGREPAAQWPRALPAARVTELLRVLHTGAASTPGSRHWSKTAASRPTRRRRDPL